MRYLIIILLFITSCIEPTYTPQLDAGDELYIDNQYYYINEVDGKDYKVLTYTLTITGVKPVGIKIDAKEFDAMYYAHIEYLRETYALER